MPAQNAHFLDLPRSATVLILLGLAVWPRPASAEAPSGRLTLATRKVVVFKDGYALLIKQARGVADAEGRVYTLEVPDSAVLGSFWATGEGANILAMRAEFTDDWKRVDAPPSAAAEQLGNLLNRLVDKPVTLTTVDDKLVAGEFSGHTVIKGRGFLLVTPTPVDAAGGSMNPPAPISVAMSDVAAVRSPALSLDAGADTRFVRAKRLSYDMGPTFAGKPVSLTLMYFAPGIRWIPTYRLSGALSDSLDMALQAEILNQSEDLRDVALDLVVGVPHFRFRTVISPLSLEAALRNTLADVAPQLMGQMSNAMFTQRAGEWRDQRSRPPASADIELPAELRATGEQDMYVYSVPHFSLRAGGRATVPLWQAQVPLRHVYTLDMNVVRHARHGSMLQGESDDAPHPTGSPLRLLKTQVWHQLDLTNPSKTPWTTGAAMILRDELPVGQDLLTYTPPGGSSLLPMTVAVNLRGTLREEEIERKPNALNWGGHNYSLIRKKGTITLTSFREAPSRMRVSVSLPGKAEVLSGDGEVRIDDFHSADWREGGFWQNNHTELVWELELKPGQTVDLEYQVSFFVP